MTPAITDLLRETMQERFGGSVTRLAEACDVSVQLASKWVSENARYRVTPGPASCEKIAAAFCLDPDYVMELAGHRKPRADAADLDQVEQLIRARTAEMREAVRGVPRVFWATIINSLFDRAIGGARDMARLLTQVESESALPGTVSSLDEVTHNKRRKPRILPPGSGEPGLDRHQRFANAVLVGA